MSAELERYVRARAPARLHLGFFDLNGGLGRKFGSLGLAIDQPHVELTLAHAAVTSVTGADHVRATRYLHEAMRILDVTQPLALHIESAIPAHHGFGSGTQMALAIVAALAKLSHRTVDVAAEASRFERGARSGIGIGAFTQGGFVIDGGRGPTTDFPQIVARIAFPQEWRLLMVMDHGLTGVHGEAESAAFRTLPGMSAEECGVLCRLVLMKLLPGLVEHDIHAVGQALTTIQSIVGDYFSPAQNGQRFASRDVADVLEQAQEIGAAGIGQTSWGPTGFALFPSEHAALEAKSAIEQALPENTNIELILAQGRNVGADIQINT